MDGSTRKQERNQPVQYFVFQTLKFIKFQVSTFRSLLGKYVISTNRFTNNYETHSRNIYYRSCTVLSSSLMLLFHCGFLSFSSTFSDERKLFRTKENTPKSITTHYLIFTFSRFMFVFTIAYFDYSTFLV